jgi:hypothetical protein
MMGLFPFCVADISGDVNLNTSYIDNLTPAQVVAFAWNFESFTINTDGAATSGALVATGTMAITLSPAASDVLTTLGTGGDWGGDMWYGAPIGATVIGSFPNIRQPRERVCYGASIEGVLLDWGGHDGASRSAQFEFLVGTDPVNAGKYRLYYNFEVTASDPGTGTVHIFWKDDSSGGSATPFASGTITLGGLTFNWYSFYTAGAPSGTGAMTASSTSFTY